MLTNICTLNGKMEPKVQYQDLWTFQNEASFKLGDRVRLPADKAAGLLPRYKSDLGLQWKQIACDAVNNTAVFELTTRFRVGARIQRAPGERLPPHDQSQEWMPVARHILPFKGKGSWVEYQLRQGKNWGATRFSDPTTNSAPFVSASDLMER